MNNLPLQQQFALQKLYNDIDTLSEKDAKQIAKDFAKLYFTTKQIAGNLILNSNNINI